MKRVIFSIYISIPDAQLDNPHSFDASGNPVSTDKSFITKKKLTQYKDKLVQRQKEYADLIGADYKLFENDEQYEEFSHKFSIDYPQISQYDVVNFYKHYLMKILSDSYDYICYFDLDIIPNTAEDIFSCANLDIYFAVPDSNEEAEWGKKVNPKYYNTCIRNPATKYWNAHALLSYSGLEPAQNVYNTGIMLSSAKVIKSLDYIEALPEVLSIMSLVKNDPDSMYPKNIQRVFNYDNETVFSYLVVAKNIDIFVLDKSWHFPIRDVVYDKTSKFFHVIDKVFGRFL